MHLWTVGHGARRAADLLAALRAHGIEVVVDVRRFPASRRHPHFAQAPLRAALEGAGMRYEHLADLGGYRDAAGGYEAHVASPAWQGAFAALLRTAAGARTAILCAETDPGACHRSRIAAAALAAGAGVTHILDAARTLPGRPASRQATLGETEEP